MNISSSSANAPDDQQSQIEHLLTQAMTLHEQGESAQAIAIASQIAEKFPNGAPAFTALGIIHHQHKKYEQAVEYFTQALRLAPNIAANYSNLASALQKSGQLAQALTFHEQALRIDPNNADSHYNLAIAYFDAGRLDDALSSYEKVIELQPDSDDAYHNMNNLLSAMGDNKKALDYQDQAVQHTGNVALARYNRSLLLLRLGKLEEGFVDYDARWHQKNMPKLPETLLKKTQWHGENLEGKTLLVHAEQGFGDYIQFCRYIPLIKARYGGHIICHTHPALLQLMQSVDGVDNWVTDMEDASICDYFCPILSLPKVFATTLESIPNAVPYLRATSHNLDQLTSSLPNDSLKIGLVWAGEKKHGNDHNRSVALAQLAPLLSIPGTAFYAMQKGRGYGELAQAISTHANVMDVGPQLKDFSDTAAFMQQLDLVICVDTAPAHLAGALAKPIWVMLPFVADWRWLTDRSDSPWYPSMKLFRQDAKKNWMPVIADMAENLAALAKEKQAYKLPDETRIASVLDLARYVMDSHNYEEALSIFTAASALEPRNPEHYHNQGLMYSLLGKYDKAIALFQEALFADPSHTESLTHMGRQWYRLGDIDMAHACHGAAIAQNENHIDAHCDRSVTHLLLGNLREGFEEFEWRWKKIWQEDKVAQSTIDGLQKTRWRGEDLHGKTLLIISEQGFGDTIQFARYAALAKERGATVQLLCQPSLVQIMRQSGVFEEVADSHTALSATPDYHCPILSLAHAFETSLDTIPNDTPYLFSDAALLEKWRLPLSENILRVGVVWAGASGHSNDHNRSILFAQFSQLFAMHPNIHFFSLQKGRDEDAINALANTQNNVSALGSHINDFSDTACIIDQLDLVITVDTSVAHLAGAMGKPVWTLLPFVPDWRWMLHRKDSPWYPSMQLFRQQSDQQWAPVLQQLSFALSQFKPPKSLDTQVGDILTLYTQGKKEKAFVECEALCNMYEYDHAPFGMMGLLHLREKDHENAVPYFEKALSLCPTNIDYINNYGTTLSSLGRYDEAQTWLKKGLTLLPNNTSLLTNYAQSLLYTRDCEEEIIGVYNNLLQQKDGSSACDPAVVTMSFDEKSSHYKPLSQQLRYNRALRLLRAGEYRDGFLDHEMRWLQPKNEQLLDACKPLKQWDGAALKDGILFVMGEQGRGDILHFVRYVLWAKQHVSHIVLSCYSELHRLFEEQDYIDTLIDRNTLPEVFDAYTPITSLAAVYAQKTGGILTDTPYLTSDPTWRLPWAESLDKPGIKIAITWAGNPGFIQDHFRSCSLNNIIPLFESFSDVTFYLLQKGAEEKEAIAYADSHENIISLGDKVNDYADTAAILHEMDYVISSDTSVIHLAGALAKPTYAIIGYLADWRWGLEETTSSWYPHTQLFRQQKNGSWEDVISALTEALQQHIYTSVEGAS